MLLGFLLTAPFASRFGRTSKFDRDLVSIAVSVTIVVWYLLPVRRASVYRSQE